MGLEQEEGGLIIFQNILVEVACKSVSQVFQFSMGWNGCNLRDTNLPGRKQTERIKDFVKHVE